MSKVAKISFLCALLLAVSSYALSLMAGGWINLNTVMVAVAAGLAVLAFVWDWRLYWEFFTMRTTKHGMNMGLMIVLAVVGIVCVNYLANKNNKTWDLTQEKANMLSDQTQKVLAGLKSDLLIKVFYRGQHPKIEEKKTNLRQHGNMYKDASGKVKVEFVNAYVEQEQAQRYLADLPDRDQAGVVAFVEYGGKKIRIDEPFDEAAITAALIKATREGQSKIYFVKGHGEKDVTSDDDTGLQDFVRALQEASFQVEPLDLIEKKEIPADAAVLAIIGPTVPYLDAELEWIREFVRKGGRLLLALDPGVRHNLANLVKPMGVEFANNYIVNLSTQLAGGGPATVLGRSFDAQSDVTKSLPEGAGFAIFPLASEVRPAPDKPADLLVKEIVKADKASFTVDDLTKAPTKKSETRPVTVGVEVSGTIAKVEGKGEESKPFEAVIFGDSDFLSNRMVMAGVNRDLAMNAVAQLANQKDLLSIRPKLPKGTLVTLTQNQRLFIVIAGLSLPILLLITSGVMWYRRRGA
ncbi:MAG: GldG family protein [Bdellovibrionales bacterium]|nr:GldG family protein [Bdellovibrionales bacterium]